MDRINITIILVSFYSLSHIKRISKVLKNIPIIVIENSRQNNVKKYFRNKKNIKVIIPKKNLGYGAGNNLGIKLAKSKYCLILNPDTNFDIKNFKALKSYIKKINDFGLLLPRLQNNLSKKYFSNHFNDFIKVDYKCIGNSYASGCCMLINKKYFSKQKPFDERIFLYKEETDLIKRLNQKKIDTYLLKECTVKHFGSTSHPAKINYEVEIVRNWHWVWSNVYFYKKHFGFFYALKKFSRSLISAFIKFIIFAPINNKKSKIYYARFHGIMTSLLGKNSSYRMKKIII